MVYFAVFIPWSLFQDNVCIWFHVEITRVGSRPAEMPRAVLRVQREALGPVPSNPHAWCQSTGRTALPGIYTCVFIIHSRINIFLWNKRRSVQSCYRSLKTTWASPRRPYKKVLINSVLFARRLWPSQNHLDCSFNKKAFCLFGSTSLCKLAEMNGTLRVVWRWKTSCHRLLRGLSVVFIADTKGIFRVFKHVQRATF